MSIDLDSEIVVQSDEVLISNLKNVAIDQDVIKKLANLANGTSRKRLRLCAHESIDDHIHEMFIVHPQGAYIPPHKHLGKSESLFVLSGQCDYLLFSENGEITGKRRMGDIASGHSFYFRLSESIFHSLFILTEQLVFLEVTKGPFRKSDMVIPKWAPAEDSLTDIQQFFESIEAWG
jgi:cupin fold WbuC family metalloprotein